MKYLNLKICSLFLLLILNACNTVDSIAQEENESNEEEMEQEMEQENENTAIAKISGVAHSGTSNNYSFSVEITSPDTGCDQYADWWEIVTPDGQLIYRRVLGHSHVTEQPFTRSGGPANITEDQEVLVRVHMNTTGYSTLGYKGSVANGFTPETIEEGFANELETEEPLPDGCAF